MVSQFWYTLKKFDPKIGTFSKKVDEWSIDATPLVIAHKTIPILGQTNHHLCLLRNGLDMAI